MNLTQFTLWLLWAESMHTIFAVWLTNVHSVRHIKLVTSHPQPSLVGLSLGGLGDCRLLILLNWCKLSLNVAAWSHSRWRDWFPCIYHLWHKHTLIQAAGGDEGGLAPWLFACPIARGYCQLIQEDHKGTLTHLSVASVPNLIF